MCIRSAKDRLESVSYAYNIPNKLRSHARLGCATQSSDTECRVITGLFKRYKNIFHQVLYARACLMAAASSCYALGSAESRSYRHRPATSQRATIVVILVTCPLRHVSFCAQASRKKSFFSLSLERVQRHREMTRAATR